MQDALLQHVAYQAGIWTTSNQQAPTPEGHGWTLDKESNSWLPVWTTALKLNLLSVAAKVWRKVLMQESIVVANVMNSWLLIKFGNGFAMGRKNFR